MMPSDGGVGEQLYAYAAKFSAPHRLHRLEEDLEIHGAIPNLLDRVLNHLVHGGGESFERDLQTLSNFAQNDRLRSVIRGFGAYERLVAEVVRRASASGSCGSDYEGGEAEGDREEEEGQLCRTRGAGAPPLLLSEQLLSFVFCLTFRASAATLPTRSKWRSLAPAIVQEILRNFAPAPGNVKFEIHQERQRHEKRLCMFLGILANILKHDSLLQSVVKAAGNYEALHEKLLQVTNVYLSSGTSRNRASVWVDQDVETAHLLPHLSSSSSLSSRKGEQGGSGSSSSSSGSGSWGRSGGAAAPAIGGTRSTAAHAFSEEARIFALQCLLCLEGTESLQQIPTKKCLEVVPATQYAVDLLLAISSPQTVPRDDVETTSSRNYVGIPRLELVRDLLEDLFTTAPSQAERAVCAFRNRQEDEEGLGIAIANTDPSPSPPWTRSTSAGQLALDLFAQKTSTSSSSSSSSAPFATRSCTAGTTVGRSTSSSSASSSRRQPLAAPCVTAIFELLKSFRYTSDVATSLTGIVLSVFVARSAVLRKAVVAVLCTAPVNPELEQEHQHHQYAELLAEFCVDRSGEAHQPQLAANAMGLLALCLDDAQKLPLSERHLRPLVLQLSRQADCQSPASCRLLAKLLSEKFSTRKIVLDACRVDQYSLLVQSAKRALEQRTAARDVDDQRLFLALLQLGLLLDDALAGERRERAEQVAGILLNKGASASWSLTKSTSAGSSSSSSSASSEAETLEVVAADSAINPARPTSTSKEEHLLLPVQRAQFYELLDSAECVRFLTAAVLCETTDVEEVREVWRLLLRTSQTQDVQAVLADAICERNANLEQLRNLPRVDPEVVEQLEKKLAIAVAERDSFAQQVGQRTEQVHLLNSALQKASGELVRHAETLRELQRERAAHEATRQCIAALEVEKQALQQDATDAQTLLQRLDFHAQRATENANSSLEQSLQEKTQLFAALQEAETRLKAAVEDRRGILAQNELLMVENDALREEVEREKRSNVYAKAGMQRTEEAWAGLVPKFNEQPSKRRPQASSSAGGASYGGGAATGGGYGGAARAGTLHIGGGTREGTAGGGTSVAVVNGRRGMGSTSGTNTGSLGTTSRSRGSPRLRGGSAERGRGSAAAMSLSPVGGRSSSRSRAGSSCIGRYNPTPWNYGAVGRTPSVSPPKQREREKATEQRNVEGSRFRGFGGAAASRIIPPGKKQNRLSLSCSRTASNEKNL